MENVGLPWPPLCCLLPGATAEALLFPDVLDPAVKPLHLSLSGPVTFRDTALLKAAVLRQGCASVFVRSVDGDIRLEGAEVSKPAPGRPLEDGSINYTGAWQGRHVAMDDVLQLYNTPHAKMRRTCLGCRCGACAVVRVLPA